MLPNALPSIISTTLCECVHGLTTGPTAFPVGLDDAERQIGVKQQRASEGSIKQTSQMIDSMTLGVPGQQRRSHRTHAKHASQFISLKDPKKRKQKLSGLSNGTQKRKPATSLKIFKDEEKSRGFHLPSIGK